MVTGSSTKSANVILLELIKNTYDIAVKTRCRSKHVERLNGLDVSYQHENVKRLYGLDVPTQKRLQALGTVSTNMKTFRNSVD